MPVKVTVIYEYKEPPGYIASPEINHKSIVEYNYPVSVKDYTKILIDLMKIAGFTEQTIERLFNDY